VTDTLTFAHLGPDAAAELEDTVTHLYVVTHGDVIDNPFYSAERFVERVRGYARAPGFEMVVAYHDGEPVALALGYVLPAGADWWDGLTPPVDPEFVTEDGRRTFALCELMTHPDWQGQGLAHRATTNCCTTAPSGAAPYSSALTTTRPAPPTASGAGGGSANSSPTPTPRTTTH
jgi:hypothetical protein